MLLNLDVNELSKFEDLSSSMPDASTLDKNHLQKVQARETINNFQNEYIKAFDAGDLTPSPYSYKHYFTQMHDEFGCAMYGREMTLAKGAIVVGKIHKHPVINVLLKGKLAVVSENGRRVVEAPCVYVSEPNVKRIGYVLEDCVWLNVLMTKQVGEENLNEIADFHTANTYEEVGLIDSTNKLLEIN
jgi:phosphosulfolactate synthase (CoM biosynthesis protein A)